MSWCPKCKNEYRTGIAICPDCNEVLVEELMETASLEYTSIFQTADEELKEKIVKYLLHCGQKIKEETSEVETEEGMQTFYSILATMEESKEALKEIRTVLAYDAKQENGEAENSKPRTHEPEPSTIYVDARARYQEYKSSGIMFLIFAAVFLVFGILNISGMVTLMASTASLLLIFGAAAAFLYVGITSLLKISSLKEEASKEETTTKFILTFLKEQFPKETVEQIHRNKTTDKEVTGEPLYFLQMETMKKALTAAFPDKAENYLDTLLEDYYNSLNL